MTFTNTLLGEHSWDCKEREGGTGCECVRGRRREGRRARGWREGHHGLACSGEEEQGHAGSGRREG